MQITPITAQDVRGKRLVVRADLNVPMAEGQVSDATRIVRFAEGMKPLLAQGARLVILTHFGRPGGSRKMEYSVEGLVPVLAEALGVPVAFSVDPVGPEAEAMARGLTDGQAMLCENVRFEPGEEANDPGLAAQFARLGEIFVNDAFSTAHRAHASTEGVAHLMPATAGPLMMEEIDALTRALEAPQAPAVAIVGGAKVSTKIPVLKNLVQKLDAIIVGGGMANTFLFAEGVPMGKSLHEADQVETVKEIKALAAESGCRILLPVDIVYAREFKSGARSHVADLSSCPKDGLILDAGPRSAALFNAELADANTLLWNGPLGAFEIPPFDQSTNIVAETAADLTESGLLVTIAGGGDTVAALNAARVTNAFTYVSTAGGAFLEWLEGKTLPGIAALMSAAKAA